MIGCNKEPHGNYDTINIFEEIGTVLSIFFLDDHISSIYTHILWGTAARRDHLLQTKYFKCKCRRCQDSTELGTYISGLKCIGGIEGSPCGGLQLPVNPTLEEGAWECGKCKIRLPEKVNILYK